MSPQQRPPSSISKAETWMEDFIIYKSIYIWHIILNLAFHSIDIFKALLIKGRCRNRRLVRLSFNMVLMVKGRGEEIEECYHGPTIRATAGGKAGQCTKPNNPTLENKTYQPNSRKFDKKSFHLESTHQLHSTVWSPDTLEQSWPCLLLLLYTQLDKEVLIMSTLIFYYFGQ